MIEFFMSFHSFRCAPLVKRHNFYHSWKIHQSSISTSETTYYTLIVSEYKNLIIHIIYIYHKNIIKLENCLLQVECKKRGPERKISRSKFSNIADILTVNILKNRNIASILFENRNKTSDFFTVEKIH